MKRLRALFLAMLLSLSLTVGVAGAAGRDKAPDPEPTPTVTVQPLDPQKPGEPPVEPQDDLPNPDPHSRKK